MLDLYPWAAPVLLLGVGLAVRLDGQVNREPFRILVTVMILLLGLSLALLK